LVTFATKVPDVGEDGGVEPVARLIITPAYVALGGSTQDSDTDVAVVPVTFSEVTGDGGVAGLACPDGTGALKIAAPDAVAATM
jgi:hypothetical protein